MTDGSQPVQRPHTRRLAKGPGALVQDRASLFSFRSVQYGLDPEWYMGSLLHTRQTTLVKRVHDVPYRLWGTVQAGGDLRGFLALRTG